MGKLKSASFGELHHEFRSLGTDVVQDVLLAANGDKEQARRSLTAIAQGVTATASHKDHTQHTTTSHHAYIPIPKELSPKSDRGMFIL